MRLPPRSPWFWLAAFAVWFGTLWWLSSGVRAQPPGFDFRASDKVLHFGYFFGGAGLFSAFLYRLSPQEPRWGRIILASVLIVTATGALDEWHQSWVPNRSGNDIGDLTADALGAICGALVFRRVHRVIR